jgi:desulfoferrodoxin (superoxide reductase-like protein)
MKKYVVLTLLMCLSFSVLANKTSVEIKAPAEAKKGTEITITINVKHSANSGMHHTNWVYIKIDGKEVKRWEYDKKNLPPDSNFTLEYKFTPTADCTIEAEGNCNLHGSAGIQKSTIKATE